MFISQDRAFLTPKPHCPWYAGHLVVIPHRTTEKKTHFPISRLQFAQNCTQLLICSPFGHPKIGCTFKTLQTCVTESDLHGGHVLCASDSMGEPKQPHQNAMRNFESCEEGGFGKDTPIQTNTELHMAIFEEHCNQLWGF